MAVIEQLFHHVSLSPRRVLVVGLGGQQSVIVDDVRNDAAMDPGQNVSFTATHLQALSREVLAQSNPHIVLCALFARHSGPDCADAVAVIEKLQFLAYRGRIAVLAPALPCPHQVESELRALGPGLRLRLIANAG